MLDSVNSISSSWTLSVGVPSRITFRRFIEWCLRVLTPSHLLGTVNQLSHVDMNVLLPSYSRRVLPDSDVIL